MLREAGAAFPLKMSGGGYGSRLKAGTTRRASLFRRLDPFRGTSPQRVAVFGAEKTEMADPLGADVRGRNGQDFRIDGDEPRAQQFNRRRRRPGIVGKAQRAHRPAELRKVLQRLEVGVVEQIAPAHDPADPLLKHAPWQILTDAAPARRVAQYPGEGSADVIQHDIDAITLRRGHQL